MPSVKRNSLDETYSVYLFSTLGSGEQVFHAYGGNTTTADLTVCGRVLYDTCERYHALLRTSHALKFARPCRKCFASDGGAA